MWLGQRKIIHGICVLGLAFVLFCQCHGEVSSATSTTHQRIAERVAAIRASGMSKKQRLELKTGRPADSKIDSLPTQKAINSASKSKAGLKVSLHCPVLLSGSKYCDTPPAGLPAWCLPPMKIVDGRKIMRLARKRNKGLGGICTCNGSKFATELRDDDIARFRSLDQFTINRNNTHVTRILSPKYWRTNPLNDLPRLREFNFSLCAVVGSSDSVFKRRGGQDIDSHDVIFRFNEAPTIGYEDYVGSRTTFRIQNPEREGFTEGKGEWCLTKGYGVGKRSGNCKLVPLSPQFNEYTRHLWSLIPTPSGISIPFVNGIERSKMSSGFQGIVLAFNLCRRVTIYGVSQGSGYYFPKVPTKSTLPWQKRHPWEVERMCLKTLTEMLPSQVKIVH